MHVEQLNAAETAEEMRAEIHRIAHYDALVRRVMDVADYMGTGAEDRYTLLAYHALRDRARLLDSALTAAATMPPASLTLEQTKE